MEQRWRRSDAALRDVPTMFRKEEFALRMALRRNDAVIMDVPIMSKREEYASLMAQQGSISDAALMGVPTKL
jgi:hypothetical protein